MDMNAETSARLRKGVRIVLSVFVGLASVPYFVFGSYLLVCWTRIHITAVYYVGFPYLGVGLGCISVGLVCLGLTLFSAFRRSFYGLLYLIPTLLGLYAMVTIPNVLPLLWSSSADENYLGGVGAYFRVWYENHCAFPADQAQFAQAFAEGAAAFYGSGIPEPQSQYKRHGQALPYQVLVFPNATGPRVDNLSERPGVVYYCVSADRRQFWVTMTSLDTVVAPSATIKRGILGGEVRVVQAKGGEYPGIETHCGNAGIVGKGKQGINHR